MHSGTEAGKLMILNVKYTKIEAGIKDSILEHPSIHLPYLTPTWITSIRQFLFQHNMKSPSRTLLPSRYEENKTTCVMNRIFLSQYYTTAQQLDINLVRLYLQVITLSDLSMPEGNKINGHFLRGERSPHQHIRQLTCPRQESPTTAQTRLW